MAGTGIASADKDVQVADLSSNEPELRYSANSDLDYRKKLGQFFTPYPVASFMSQWLTEIHADEPRILDPCAGLGVFERAICAIDPDLARNAQFTLWEKDASLACELSGICDRLAIDHDIADRDFLDEHGWSEAYDGIIANPPYYKHHFVDNKEQVRATIAEKTGAHFSVQTNVYCWFLIKSLALLKPGGRLAFIIPTEFLNANYGREVKQHLLDSGCLRHIISIDYKSKTFDDAITTACVILADRDEHRAVGVRFYNTASSDQLGELTAFLEQGRCIEYWVSELDTTRKWRSYFPGNSRVSASTAQLVPLSRWGRFSRGIATGANEFFAIRASTARERGLPGECLIPCLSKARQAPGKVFTGADFASLVDADQAVYLFDAEAATGKEIDRYLRFGEQSGYQHRYLTSSRSPWYALEKRAPSNIWVGVFGRAGVRFIWNETRCLSLTCFHVFQPVSAGHALLPLLFLYLHTDIGRQFLELEKREYGDGLEKYEPNDINKVLTPDFELLGRDDRQRLVELHRTFLNAESGSSEEQTILEAAGAVFSSLI